ncbi:MAG: ADP-heptose:LPS heptosyltransferase [Parasphingorhabdus sp.]
MSNNQPIPFDHIQNLLDTGQAPSARAIGSQYLQNFPDDTSLLGLVGTACLECGETTVALALLEKASSREPFNVNWHWAIGRAYARCLDNARVMPEIGDDNRLTWPAWMGRGFSALQRTTLLSPADSMPWLLLGRYAKAMGDNPTAVTCAEQILATQPDHLEALLLAAESYHYLRDQVKTEAMFERLFAVQNDHAMGQWLHSMQLLLQGEFEQGWAAYDTRLENFGFDTTQYPFPLPLWQGEDIAGKRILVHGEQGLGDEVMFSSIIPDLIQAGAKVTLSVSPTLAQLFLRSFADIRIYTMSRDPEAVDNWRRDAPPPNWFNAADYDFHCPNGSLPRWLRRRVENFPQQAYLQADKKLTEAFRQQIVPLDSEQPLVIGLNLTANLSTGRMGAEKTVLPYWFEFLQPLQQQGKIRVVGLQLHDMLYDSLPWVFDPRPQISNFDHTAALADACDLIITVDTSVAHVTAALGKPTWVLLKFDADWRFLLDTDDSPWYSDMRLFRQNEQRDWSRVVGQIQHQLEQQLNDNNTSPDERET